MLTQPRKSCKEESAQSYPVSESPDEHTGMLQGSCCLFTTESDMNYNLTIASSTCLSLGDHGFVSYVDRWTGDLRRSWEVNMLAPEPWTPTCRGACFLSCALHLEPSFASLLLLIFKRSAGFRHSYPTLLVIIVYMYVYIYTTRDSSCENPCLISWEFKIYDKINIYRCEKIREMQQWYIYYWASIIWHICVVKLCSVKYLCSKVELSRRL